MVTEVSAWFPGFDTYVTENYLDANAKSVTDANVTQEFFDARLTQFLFSPTGAKFMDKFVFDGDIKCGQPAPKVLVRSHATSDKFFFMSVTVWLPMDGRTVV